MFPQTGFGDDPAAIRDYAQTVEGLGVIHNLAIQRFAQIALGSRMLFYLALVSFTGCFARHSGTFEAVSWRSQKSVRSAHLLELPRFA